MPAYFIVIIIIIRRHD